LHTTESVPLARDYAVCAVCESGIPVRFNEPRTETPSTEGGVKNASGHHKMLPGAQLPEVSTFGRPEHVVKRLIPSTNKTS
jgi:hypothetical protein